MSWKRIICWIRGHHWELLLRDEKHSHLACFTCGRIIHKPVYTQEFLTPDEVMQEPSTIYEMRKSLGKREKCYPFETDVKKDAKKQTRKRKKKKKGEQDGR